MHIKRNGGNEEVSFECVKYVRVMEEEKTRKSDLQKEVENREVEEPVCV